MATTRNIRRLRGKQIHKTGKLKILQRESKQEPDLAMRLTALEQRVAKGFEAVSANFGAFQGGFEFTDRWLHILRRILDEAQSSRGILHLVPKEGPPGNWTIDWEEYFVEYEAMRALVVLAETHCQPSPEPPAEEPSDDLGVTVFGGDHHG